MVTGRKATTVGGAAAYADGRCGGAEGSPAVSRRRRSAGCARRRRRWRRGDAATAAAAPGGAGGDGGAPAAEQVRNYPKKMPSVFF
jgi:hypothetical protein